MTVLAQGHFLTFDNQIDATTGTVKAKARFENPRGRLFPNQFVNVMLLVDTLKQAVVVPIGAVRHGAQGDFVFVLQPDKTVKLQTVKTGPGSEQRIAILSGVKPGSTVVTEGADSLDDGSKVTLPRDRPARSGKGGTGGARRRHQKQQGGGGGQ
jgi:multidrug efflux system membrane fusion protein